MVRENIVTPANFIYPLFIHDEDFNQDIVSMPGCERHSLDSMLREVGEAYQFKCSFTVQAEVITIQKIDPTDSTHLIFDEVEIIGERKSVTIILICS